MVEANLGSERKSLLRHRNLATQHSNRTLIINGEQADPGEYPYFAHMPYPGCGGSLIAPDVILTAGHVSATEPEMIAHRRMPHSHQMCI